MKKNKRSVASLITPLFVIAVLVVTYLYFPGLYSALVGSSPATSGPVTSTPAVLSEAAPEIGHQTKTTGCKSDGILPDPECTPGAIDPNVTAQSQNGTICIVGYTGTVRPSTSITGKIKIVTLDAYSFTGRHRIMNWII